MGSRLSISADDEELAYELISESGSSEHDNLLEAEGETIVQFTSALYFVEECEGNVVIDVMRLGSQSGTVSVQFSTEDMSARSGERFEHTEGTLIMNDGDHQKSISVPILVSDRWSPTLEFKVVLSQPKGCMLGAYLHTCRVKVLDDQTFPSGKYPQVTDGMEAISHIRHLSLFLEYCKMNFSIPRHGWMTVMCLVFDQMRNAYMYYKLWAISYLLNDIFHDSHGMDPDIIDERVREAFFLGMGYILPMFALHAWELFKVRIDLNGHSRTFLQKTIVSRYLNYSAESRYTISVADVEIAVREDAAEVARAYVAVLAMFNILVKTIVMLFFVHIENPRGLRYALAILGLMFAFGCLRSGKLSKASELPILLSSKLLEYVGETVKNYRLIANYFMRPHMDDIFDKKASVLRLSQTAPHSVKVNNEYFPQWLGPVFVGIYIITHTRLVLMGEMGHGTFVATMNVFNEMSTDLSEGYKKMMEITSIAGILKGMTLMLNLPTDLFVWKTVNRKRRASTTVARQKVLSSSKSDHPFPTDLIEFEIKDVSFTFTSESVPHEVLKNVNLTVPQGSMVAVLGQHGRGRQTFLRLIAHELFPTTGEIFIPTHLRILHVSQEVYTLDTSALLNLTFGHVGADVDRVKTILERFSAWKLLEEIQVTESLHTPKGGSSGKTTVRTANSMESEADTEDGDEESCLCRLCTPGKQETDPHDSPDIGWLKTICYSEKAKLHLARALIMNPEVMVLQRPLVHFNQQEQGKVLELLSEHVRNRGVGLPEDLVSIRRPRTVFLSVDHEAQAEKADIVWKMNDRDASSSVTVLKENGPFGRMAGSRDYGSSFSGGSMWKL